MQGRRSFDISRRTFVKWATTASALAALPVRSGLLASPAQSEQTAATLLAGTQPLRAPLEGVWKPSMCWQNCGGRCLNKVFMVGNTIIRQKTDDSHPDSADFPQQRGCLRGRSQRRHVLGADRIRYPMIRKHWVSGGGDKSLRGRDQWVRISWDKALDIIASETKRITEKYGQDSLWLTGKSSDNPHYHNIFAAAGGFTADWGTLSTGAWEETAGLMGLYWGYFGINDRFDLRKSQLIVLWGANAAWSSPGNPTNYLLHAKQAGAKFICIDPVYTDVAELTDADWVPVNPATDQVLALGIMYVLLEEDDPEKNPLIDWDFLHRCTVGFDADHMPPGSDPKDNFRDYLLGTYTGEPKTPEWASDICGVPPSVIRKLARQIGGTKRVALTCGWAPARINNGEGWVQAFSTLGFMTGHMGRPGRMTGPNCHSVANNNGTFLVNPGKSGLPQIANPLSRKINHNELNRALHKGKFRQAGKGEVDINIQMIFHVFNNTMQTRSNIKEAVAAYRKTVEFVVAPAFVYTTNAKYSDLVLPVATPWERVGFFSDKYARECLFVTANVIPQLYESQTDQWIAKEIGKRLGLEIKKIFPTTEKQQFFNELAGATVIDTDGQTPVPLVTITREDIEKWGVTGTPQQGKVVLDKFLADGKYQVRRQEGDNYGFIAFEDFVRDPAKYPRKTESGKFEIYCRQLNARSKDYGWSEVPPIPKYIPPVKGYESTFEDWSTREKGPYPFQIVTPHYLRTSHSTFDNVQQLQEAMPSPVLLNAADAKRLNIRHGDTVLVSTSMGKVLRPANVTQTIKPGVVSLPHGRWANIDEKTGIDSSGADNVLYEQVPTGLGTSGWNSGICNVEKWHGEKLNADALCPLRLPTFVEQAK